MIQLALLLLLAAEPAAAAASTNEVASPVFATTGYTKAAEVEKGCVARSIRLPASLNGLAADAMTKFAVGPDGAVSRFEELTAAPEQVTAAIWAAVQRCQFTAGKDPRGEPVSTWLLMPIRFQPGSSPAATRTSNPLQEAEPGCFQYQLRYRLPPNRLLRGRLEFRVAVTAEGKASAVDLPADLPSDARQAIQYSIESCEYRPARDAGGRAVAGRFDSAINFAQPGEAERAVAAPRLKREARLASTTCLQRIRPPGVIGHVVVQVRVTADGVPTDFRLKPDNVSADHRLHVFEVLSTCTWEPAIGLDDQPVAGDAVVTIRYR